MSKLSNVCDGNITCIFALAGTKLIFGLLFIAAGWGIVASYRWLTRKKTARKKHMNEVAYSGHLAFQNKLEIEDNPYAPGSEDHDYWLRGYQLARRKKET